MPEQEPFPENSITVGGNDVDQQLPSVESTLLSVKVPPTEVHQGKQESQLYEPFSYVPLHNAREIRLLKASPAQLQDNKSSKRKYQLGLYHYNLANLPIYTAVSYVWGTSAPTKRLIVNNQDLRVRPNVRSILNQLCDGVQTNYLWIDAICINQEDLEERSGQVSLMAEIFSSANYVIGFLDTDGGKLPIGLHNVAAEIRQISEAVHDAVEYYSVSKGSSLSKRNFDSSKLFQNEFFRRRWIIQEICLARSVVLSCGGYELPLALLGRYFETSDGGRAADNLASHLWRLRLRMISEESKRDTLESLLYEHESAMCSDFRDKVYALLALTGETGHKLAVDYSIPPLKLLMNVLRFSIHHQQQPPDKLLGFACFLERHLRVSMDDLHSVITLNLFEELFRDDGGLRARVRRRGIVRTSVVEPLVESRIPGLRSQLPAIAQYPDIELVQISSGSLTHSIVQKRFKVKSSNSQGNNDQKPTFQVYPNSLWVFSYTLKGQDTPQDSILGGLSTTVTKTGDEIWQFIRTPFALVVRTSVSGYNVIGRAVLLRPGLATDLPGYEFLPSRITKPKWLERVIDWCPSEARHDRNVELDLQLNPSDLVRLMRWVDVDIESRD